MTFGIYLIFSPIIDACAWIPLVGYMLSNGVAFVVLIFALTVAATLTFSTITAAWLYYRPMYGLIFLALTIVGLTFIFMAPQEEQKT